LEGSGRGLIEIPFRHLLGKTEEYLRKESRYPAEIRTEHLLNASLEHYRYVILLGASSYCLSQMYVSHNHCSGVGNW
jgi:hypothetical protein